MLLKEEASNQLIIVKYKLIVVLEYITINQSERQSEWNWQVLIVPSPIRKLHVGLLLSSSDIKLI